LSLGVHAYSAMPQILYHYTDFFGYSSIQGTLRQADTKAHVLELLGSAQATSGDAHYGDGWYFTNIPPDKANRRLLARVLWDGSFERNLHKTEYYLALEFHGRTTFRLCRPRVYLVPRTSMPQPTLVDHGPTLGRDAPQIQSRQCRFCAARFVVWKSLELHLKQVHPVDYATIFTRLPPEATPTDFSSEPILIEERRGPSGRPMHIRLPSDFNPARHSRATPPVRRAEPIANSDGERSRQRGLIKRFFSWLMPRTQL
jgi:hypothetical protein